MMRDTIAFRPAAWIAFAAVNLALAGCAGLCVGCDEPAAPGPKNGPLAGETVRMQGAVWDLQGRMWELGENGARQTRVFVMMGVECPIANGMIGTLNAIHQQCRDLNVGFFGAVSDRSLGRGAALRHYAEYKATFPIVFDGSGALRTVLRPTHVPEAFVLDPNNRLVYRGAIDNAWIALNRRRPTAERHYLADAIAAAARSATPTPAYVPPVGCLVEDEPAPAETKDGLSATAGVTYHRDIAPILQSRCMNCHRPGLAAPFALTSYAQAVKHAKQTVTVTQDRIMPPWVPQAGGHAEKFVGERWLTDRELTLLQTWVSRGCVEGDPADAPPAPAFAEGWRLGKPDLILKMPQAFAVPADGPDLLQNFVIPVPLTEDRLVSAVEFRPGNARVAHHAVFFLDISGQARVRDAATPEPGYSNDRGPGFPPSGALGGWSVGNTPRRLPDGMGRHLRKGSDLVVQMHYHPTGKPEKDQSEIGIHFLDKTQKTQDLVKQPSKLVGSIWTSDYEIRIPAGDSDYRRTMRYTLPKAITLVGIVPHMHMLGKNFRTTAHLPDGRAIPLINIPRWNYNWQDEYYYEKPFKLPAGTVLETLAAFDNSENNPSNPNLPPVPVTYGDGTHDEMLFCFFLFTADSIGDLLHTVYHNLGDDAKRPRLTATAPK